MRWQHFVATPEGQYAVPPLAGNLATGLPDAATQVFGDFVHALQCGAGLFVGAVPRTNATLGAVGAGALAVDI